jgi:hypothetical protein
LPHPVDFRSPAYRSLIKTLGESDAVVEWIEVGMREIERINKASGSHAAEQLAASHGICVHPIDPTSLRSRCARLQVLAVYQQIEYFFRAFRKTHPRQVEYSRKSGQDSLVATLAAFRIAPAQVGQLEVDLFQYYRAIRNLTMHHPEGGQRKKHRRICRDLRLRVKNSTYYALEAPNTLEELGFDDFVLFTRIGKQIAANLCTTTNPTDDELAACARNNDPLMKKVRSLSNNRQRCENLVAGFFRERYSISDSRSRRLSQLVLGGAR